ncbi:hypothetical protein [Microbulbifer spongiae]|uniref:RnfABCDGE type electron transport complex subunit D n=1 Tax=Microbulbifer spongiae TaxID=2944933 RepID=A0ABY9EI00_9GAMM|nr:hypothetical protein [Microbulbifer sp. MI-G]WKD51574.1 RnfABCDGE type electron transport complex subunit D [Microbulbifer sp. MI-G]
MSTLKDLFVGPPNLKMALINSASLATVLTVFGHAFLGFEQSLMQMAVALMAGYSSAILFEYIDAKCLQRRPRYLGNGWSGFVFFMLPAHMTAITISFLIYVNDSLLMMVFAVVLAIGSKHVFRYKNGSRYQHFFNPSNFGIAVIFLVAPWANIIVYQFTETYSGFWDWLVLIVIALLGMRMNLFLTKRMAIILAWVSGFFLQAFLRGQLYPVQMAAEITMITAPAFVLFTFYMITDPMTSPSKLIPQIVFGFSIAMAYGVLMYFHVVFAIFFAVTIVTGSRGLFIMLSLWFERQRVQANLAGNVLPSS